MEYRKFDDVIVLRLDPGEEVLAGLKEVAERESVRLASVSGLGAVNEIVVGVYDVANKHYNSNSFSGYFEITSLTGTITEMDGEVYLHIHLSAGDEKGNVVGGHLNKAVVSATAEIVIRTINGAVGREFSPEIGLNLFKFE